MTAKYLGENLIFIVSLPRSGSTLMQRILAGHSEIGTSSEPWILLHQAYGRRAAGIVTEYGADWAALGVNEFIEYYTDGDEVYDDAVRAFARTLYDNAMQRAGATLFVDKTPRYVLILPELMRWFPRARFVFLLRNPLAVLSSVIRTQINHDLTTLERFARELLEGPRAMLDAIEALGERAIVVRYEEFVAEPEAGLQRVCDALGVTSDPAMLEYQNTPEIQGFMKDRTGVNRHARPSGERADGWRQLLDDSQSLAFARGYLDDLGRETVTRLGYDWSEFDTAIQEARRRLGPGRLLFPWHVAILTPAQKRGRDQFHVVRYRAIRDRGVIIGLISAGLQYLRGLGRAFAFTVQSHRRADGSMIGRRDGGPGFRDS